MQTYDSAAIKAEAKNLFQKDRNLYMMTALMVVAATLVLMGVSMGFLAMLLTGLVTVTADSVYLNGWRETPIALGDAISATFDEGFLRKMGGMLWMEVKTFLWSLLFVIPGIVKALGYLLTPYILYDCPNVPAMEASRLSERITRGHKSELFITWLSFLGWMLLSALTLNILYVVYVGPYMQLTYAGIYEELKQLAIESGAVTQAELDGQTL